LIAKIFKAILALVKLDHKDD